MSEIKYLDINGLQTFKQEEDALLQGKQETLVSGTNIKTIGGQSILGSGDLAVGGGLEIIEANTLSEYATETLTQEQADKIRQCKAVLACRNSSNVGNAYYIFTPVHLNTASSSLLLRCITAIYNGSSGSSAIYYDYHIKMLQTYLGNDNNRLSSLTQTEIKIPIPYTPSPYLVNHSSVTVEYGYETGVDDYGGRFGTSSIGAGSYKNQNYMKKMYVNTDNVVVTANKPQCLIELAPKVYGILYDYNGVTITFSDPTE